MIKTPFDNEPFSGCICFNEGAECVCPQCEAVLRAFAARKITRSMTPDERAWCLDEIASVEGYDRRDYAEYLDGDLAHTVIVAWADYCRDKGLL